MTNELQKFDRVLKEILKVSHSEIKDKLDAEKVAKKWSAAVYDTVYSQNIGLCGFRCRVGACTKVVRSYRGIVMHCKRVHRLVAQMELSYAGTLHKEHA